MVFSKTTGSVFNGSNIHRMLISMGLANLVVVCVMTSGCVECAARDAEDPRYRVVVVDDACPTWSEELHRALLRVLDEVYARIKITEEVLRDMSSRLTTALNGDGADAGAVPQ